MWSSGVILFAILAGRLPFVEENVALLYKKIKHAKYEVPKFVLESAKDLISKMLRPDPAKRITISEIRVHPWFVVDLKGSEIEAKFSEKVLLCPIIRML